MKQAPRSLAFQVVVFSLARTVVNTSYRMIYPYLSTFQSGLGVSLPAISLVLTLRALLGFASPFFAPLADRRGRRVSMLLGLGGFTFGALVVTLWPTYIGFFISLLMMSLSYLIFLPAMQAYLGDRVPYQRRGRVMGITELSWSLAFIVGVPLVGWLLASSGNWAAPFLILAILGGIFFVALWVFIPNDHPQSPKTRAAVERSAIRQILSNRNVRAGLLMGLMITSANETVNLVFGVWLEDAFAFKLAALGAASVVIGLSEMGGEGLSAWLVDRLGKQWSIRVGLLVNALAAVGLVFMGQFAWSALLGLFVFYLSFEFTLVSALPMMSEALPKLRATVMASTIASFAIGRALGAFAAPLLYTGLGFSANAVVAVGFNLLALVMLSRIKISESGETQIAKIEAEQA
jgi:predicted MFS family arabinose efflux permease